LKRTGRERKKALWPPVCFLLAVHLAVLGAEWVAPYDPREQDRTLGFSPPSALHLAGTDRFGRDLLSRLLYGGRTSLGAGLLAGLAAVGLGLVVGTAAGHRGGRLDGLLMRLGELFMAFPALFLLVAVRAALPLGLDAGLTLLVTALVIGLLAWVQPARLVRGVVLSAKERDFVHAARGFGASEVYLLWRHVLPQAWPVVSTHLALLVPQLVLAEVTLSFLGLGIAEPAASWGLMLAELSSYETLVSRWWMSLPAVALTAVIIGYHQMANALRGHRSAAGL
jgi:peptide/nickel transport system permease protein